MKITEKNLDVSLDLALKDLKKNLEEPGKNNTGEKVSKVELLSKARQAFREGRISLLESGNLESRLNKGQALKPEHIAILGLTDGAKIAGLSSPKQSAPESRMGKVPGRPATRIATGAPAPENPVVAAMMLGQKLTHSFQAPNNEIMKVSGSEILTRCAELVKSNKMSLMRAGDLERLINSGAAIRPEILRELFT